MKLSKLAGATSEIWQIFIQDASSTVGAGLPGLVFNTSGLTAYFHRDTDTAATAISLVTMTAGTFTSSGLKEIDATHMPGWYQFCPPNAAIASGAKSVGIHLQGATNMAPLALEVQLTAVNPDSASAFVSGVNVATIGGQTASASGTITFPNATLASTTNITAGTLTTVTTATNLTNAPTAGDFTATMKASIGTAVAASAVASVTGNLGGNVVGSVGSVTGAVGSVTGNVGGNVTGSVGSLATQAKTDVANAAWDATLSGHLTSGSTGAALNAAGSSGDPWATSLPGAYGAGTAGFIMGTNLDATITSRLAPTAAGHTLDVTATGAAGIDWGNVENPTTTVTLSATTVATTQKVDVNTIKTQTVTAAAGVTFPTSIASPTNITAGTITTVTTVTNLTNAATAGDFTTTMKTSIGTAVAASAVASVTGNVGGNVTGNVTGSVGSVVGAVGSVTGAVGSVTGNVGGNVTGSVASVTARVTANTDQLAGQTVSAAAGVTFPSSVASPTNITAASGVALTSAYDAAKTAAQAGDVMKVSSGTGANQISLSSGVVAADVKKINATTVNGDGSGTPWGP